MRAGSRSASAGSECIGDLDTLRADAGLYRLLGRAEMAPSTAHDLLRGIGPAGLEDLSAIQTGRLSRVYIAGAPGGDLLDCDATLF